MIFSENDFTLIYRYIGKLNTNITIEKGKNGTVRKRVAHNDDCIIM